MCKHRLVYKIVIFIMPLLIIGLLVNRQIAQIQEYSYGTAELIINEVMADNLNTLKNENGIYADWIEIYNPSSYHVNMGNYYLSDDKNDLSKWKFPDIFLEAEGYLVVFCDNYDNASGDELHTNFMINSDKETIYLSTSENDIVDMVKLEKQKCNVSYGRVYGEASQLGFLPYSTAGQVNPSSFWQYEKEEKAWGNVLFSRTGGIYDSEFELELSFPDKSAVILYTLDGSEPDISSYIYNKPIKITGEGKINKYTTKKCIANSDEFENWETDYGVSEVYKGQVVRARVLKDGMMSSDIQTNTYFINPQYSLPIVSLVVSPNTLFDDKDGSYVLGYTYYTLRKYNMETDSGNYYIKNNMQGHIEIYDNDQPVFNDDITFSLSGDGSLVNNIQKSFNINLNSKEINGKLLGAEPDIAYNSFSLRGPGACITMDFTYSYISSFISNYLKDLNIGAQTSRPCILFIDGEYWGIYNLMEPKGKEYISKNYNIKKKDISVVIPYLGQSTSEFDKFYDAAADMDFSDKESYDWIKTQINMDNFMQFILAEAYFANTDGLNKGDHNYYIWKGDSGLWNWQAFDFDSTMNEDENYFNDLINFEFPDVEGEEKRNFSMWLFKSLWNNAEFRREFYALANDRFDDIYKKENVLAAFESHIETLEGEMEENLLRCSKDYNWIKRFSFKIRGITAEYDNYTINDWYNTVDDLYAFLENRTDMLKQYLNGLYY